MSLTYLSCDRTKVTDLSLLKDMPLKFLCCDFKSERDAAILRSIKTLETINDRPAPEFWKRWTPKRRRRSPDKSLQVAVHYLRRFLSA